MALATQAQLAAVMKNVSMQNIISLSSPPGASLGDLRDAFSKYMERSVMQKRHEDIPGLSVTMGKFDALELKDVPIDGLLAIARRTLGNAMRELRQPDPKASSESVRAGLYDAMLLSQIMRTVEDHLFDWNLDRKQGTTLKAVYDLFHDADRENRMRHRRRESTDILSNAGKRVEENIDNLRRYEMRLREQLREPFCLDFDYDDLRLDGVVDACFDAALALEAYYEERAFGPTA